MARCGKPWLTYQVDNHLVRLLSMIGIVRVSEVS